MLIEKQQRAPSVSQSVDTSGDLNDALRAPPEYITRAAMRCNKF